MKKNKENLKPHKSYVDGTGEVEELDAEWFAEAVGLEKLEEQTGLEFPRRGRPALTEEEKKKRVTIMLDQDVIAHFKKGGKGWQTRANAALRKAAGL